ncbi:MAG: acyl-CoA desaturase [Acidobacteriota bacterium]
MTFPALCLRNFNWTTGSFIIVYHLGLLIGLPFYFYYSPPDLNMILASAGLLLLTEIGIGAGYHRYYAHRCYSISKPAEIALLSLGSLATQGSVLHWAHDHRLHHSYVDTDSDPYSIKKGFWYAHILWMFTRRKPIDEQRVSDLLGSRLVLFQHKHHAALSIGGNALVCALVGWLLGDYLGAFVLSWWTRLFVSHHLTWFVNSIAHTWGERTYSREQSAVDNYILAFLTVGEGYHNYHHTFASDYRNGFRWYHFDPTKWVIWSLSKIGLARDLVRFDLYRIRRRLLGEDCRLLLKTIRERERGGKPGPEQKIIQFAERMRAKLARISRLSAELQKPAGRKRAAAPSATLEEFRALRRSLRRDWKEWSRVCARALQASPAPS